jgi:predicted nucleotidyltransferase
MPDDRGFFSPSTPAVLTLTTQLTTQSNRPKSLQTCSNGKVFVGGLLERRREETKARIAKLREDLQEAESICAGNACMYATGSFARGEASQHSDLDLFIVGQVRGDKRSLRRLDEIRVKADLIEVTQRHKIPEFSGDGEYLVHYTVQQLVKTLGKPDDDAANTFTACLLMVLESRPLLEESVYQDVIEEVLGAYWLDYEDHKNEFIPAFLTNGILRLWRTFCVNYEARTAREPEEKRAKRKIKNYKLKHSRLLTCYSGLLYLLGVFSARGTVTPTDAAEMVALTPTERLE